MRNRFAAILLFTLAATEALATRASSRSQDPVPLTVHEWGTFTSIAGPDGMAVEWLPNAGQSDLPCFVEQYGFNLKGGLSGTVRMETPVLYFYAPRDLTATVHLAFRHGVITDWFPHAAVKPAGANNVVNAESEGRIAWTDVKVSPGLTAEFPDEGRPSHYYAARNTDAAPLQSGAERERFLFYRGVGRFAPPLVATVDADGAVAVRSATGRAIGSVIMFENRGGRIAYDVRHLRGSDLTFDPLTLEDESGSPAPDLVRILTANGLYDREAQAMVETWRDSWFEEGARLFYIVPREAVEAILPLTINPAPSSVVRVFVGRMELVTPMTRSEVAEALAANDRATLQKYARFLSAIGRRVLEESPAAVRAQMTDRLNAATPRFPSRSCGGR
jgi:hypothetical protein